MEAPSILLNYNSKLISHTMCRQGPLGAILKYVWYPLFGIVLVTAGPVILARTAVEKAIEKYRKIRPKKVKAPKRRRTCVVQPVVLPHARSDVSVHILGVRPAGSPPTWVGMQEKALESEETLTVGFDEEKSVTSLSIN